MKKQAFKREDKEDLLALKEAVDLSYLLDTLGFSHFRENSKEIRATCSIHGGDNRSAFRLNKETRTWVCFTHKCHEIYGNDVIGLIQGTLGLNFVEAVKYLRNLVGDVSAFKKNLAIRKFMQSRKNFVAQYSAPEKPSYVSNEALKKFSHFRSQYFIEKGFSDKVLDFFEVGGGFTDEWGVVRDIIPIRNVKGELVAYSLRDIVDREDDDFKYILTEGFIKDSVLYNLHNARLFGTKIPLIVVEGFKSVWKLHEYGIYNTVAVMGSFLTEGGIKLLKAYALKGVVLFFDPDKAGEEGDILAQEALKAENIKVSSVCMSPEEGEDPADLTLEQAYRYLDEYIR